ncbi:hypothetical protein PIB30_018471 [Stylosanthes scabra]|uniref:Uncharacterized protein n=1 Tax=Stylosanthes scabra TaxID=79078 RepID=A0ABU6VA72_9FABA|nr:hypothetical protein [Stylosanthes scabra]
MASTIHIKNSIFAILIFLCTCTFRSRGGRVHSDESSSSIIVKKHEQWMALYGRVYKNKEEKIKRQEIFKQNLEFVERFKNDKERSKSFRVSLNHFSDLTDEEFVASYTGALHNEKAQPNINDDDDIKFGYQNMSLANIESNLDWRDKGAVNKIKQQGLCEACWAFSTVAAVEGLIKIKTGKLISLSEQQLVDCVEPNRDGCSPYDKNKAYVYMQNNVVTTESNYPYNSQDSGTCNQQIVMNNNNEAIKIKGYEMIPPNNEEELLKAVANQPVAVGIDGSEPAFKSYSGGIFTSDYCGKEINHAVTIVGYGVENDCSKYWLIRNSWGEFWGEGGYMKLERDIDDPRGSCGIAMFPAYPVL